MQRSKRIERPDLKAARTRRPGRKHHLSGAVGHPQFDGNQFACDTTRNDIVGKAFGVDTICILDGGYVTFESNHVDG